jgi:acyl carrier protein
MVMDVLKDILLELGISKELITDEALIYKDLQLDSTETVEVSLGLKRRLGVNIKFESRQDITISNICGMVNQAKDATAK